MHSAVIFSVLLTCSQAFLFGGFPNLFGCNPCNNGHFGYSPPQPYYQSTVDSYHPLMNSYAHSQTYQQHNYQAPQPYSEYHQQSYQHPEPAYNQPMHDYHSTVPAYQEPQPEYHPPAPNYHESEPVASVVPSTEGYVQPSAPVFYSSGHPQSGYSVPQENIVVKETEIVQPVAPAVVTNEHSTAVVEEKTIQKMENYETPAQIVSEHVPEIAASYSVPTATPEASGY